MNWNLLAEDIYLHVLYVKIRNPNSRLINHKAPILTEPEVLR